MKITLNEKLFEAKKDKKETDKTKSDSKSSPKKNDKETTDDEEESEPVQKIDTKSDYAKKLILLFKKSGLVSDVEYEKGQNSGIEIINFSTNNKRFSVKLKNTKFTDDNGDVVKNVNQYTFYKRIDNELKPMSTRPLPADTFEEFASDVVSSTENNKLDDPMLMSKLIPETEKEIDSGVSDEKEPESKEATKKASPVEPKKVENKPATSNDKPLSELPPTPEEGKPLPKEVTNPPESKEEKSNNTSDVELSDLLNDFVELLNSEQYKDSYKINSVNKVENRVNFQKNGEDNKKRSVTFARKKDGIKAEYRDKPGQPTTIDMSDGNVEDPEFLAATGVEKGSSKSSSVSKEKEVSNNPNRRMVPPASSNTVQTPKKPEPSKPSITPPALSRDQISKAFSSIANDQKAKQKPVEPSKEAPKNVNKSVNLDVPKVQKNEPPKVEPTVTPTVKPDVQKVVEPEVKNEPPVEQKPIPEPEIQKPAASAVSDADLSTKPEEQNPSEPVVQSEPSKEEIPAEQPVVEPSSAQPPIEEPKVEPEVAPKSTFKHPDYKDEISGKDPYTLDRAKQNKLKLQNLNDTEFNIPVSKPFSLGKKSQAEDGGELYSRTVNVDEKGNVRYIFSLKFPEANKKLFEAIEEKNLQMTIIKILNSFRNLRMQEIAITDFQNAELDGLYVPKNILTSIVISTSKNIAKAPVAQVPLNSSDKQIGDISLGVTQKISEMISNDVSMEDSITKISFVTTLTKSEKQPEEDLSGNTKIGRKINPPQVPPMKDTSAQTQDDPSYRINPNDTGVQKMARQLGITPSSDPNSMNKISAGAEKYSSQKALDPLYDKALEFIRSENNASISLLQRKFKISYERAENLIKSLEEHGQIEKPDHRGVRKIVPDVTKKNNAKDQQPSSTQGIPESEVYKTKAVFELYNPLIKEGEISKEEILSSTNFKIRDMNYRNLFNEIYYMANSDSLAFRCDDSSDIDGISFILSENSAFFIKLPGGQRKYFSAQSGKQIFSENKDKKLVSVGNLSDTGSQYFIVLKNLQVINEKDFKQNSDEQDIIKKRVLKGFFGQPSENPKDTLQPSYFPNSVPGNSATAVGKQKGIQPDTSPISTDPTQVAPIPVQNQPVAQNQKPNAIPKLDAILQFKRAVLGHIRENLQKFMEAYHGKADILSKWLKDSKLISSNQPVEPQKAPEPQTPQDTVQKQAKKRGRPPKQQVTEAKKDNNWDRPSHQNWRNPNDEPTSERSTNLRKQDYFGPGQNRKLEKDTVMYATKESDIIDGVHKVFKDFKDKSLNKQPDLQPYIEKLQSIKFFPIKVIKLENNLFFVKSDSSDKLFVIAPTGILYERIKGFYQAPSSTSESRVVKYTKLASIPLERANISMSVMENHVEKGVCVVNAANYTK